MPHVDAFLASFTPSDYQELAWSWAMDPPPEDAIRTNNILLAELLAAFYNVNFKRANDDETRWTRADFLPDPDAIGEGEEADAGAEADDAPVALHPMAHAGARAGVAGVRSTGSVVPQGIMDLFTSNDDAPEG